MNGELWGSIITQLDSMIKLSRSMQNELRERKDIEAIEYAADSNFSMGLSLGLEQAKRTVLEMIEEYNKYHNY